MGRAMEQSKMAMEQDVAKTPYTTMSPDVLVIGGGPAGSTVSALLADRGYDVVMLEKEHHPRFHIGESLLPMNMPLFDRLGVRKEVEAMGITKYGAEFVSPWHDHTSHFFFAEAMDKSFPYAVHVRRSEFDEMLFRHAAKRGARTFEGHRVTRVDMDAGKMGDGRALVKVKSGDGAEIEWHPRFVIDASGRDTVLSNQFGVKRRSKEHASAALFGHFTNAVRQPGRNEGNISLFWFDHGWFWFIPLLDGTTSIGAVASPTYFKQRKTDPSTFLMETIALAPKLAARLKDAKMVEPATATGNFSYNSEFCRGDRFIMIGDAFTFVDPMFSSGVLLAMKSGFLAADAIDIGLRQPAKMPRQLKAFEKSVSKGLAGFTWLIFRMTTPVMREMLMYPRNILGVEHAVLAILAGDVHDNPQAQLRMKLFKLMYYIGSLRTLPSSLRAWARRRRMIRPEVFET